MKMKSISYILLLLLVASCQQSGQKTKVALQEEMPYTIDLSEVEYSEEPQLLSDFVESIEYVKLSEVPLVYDVGMIYLAEDAKQNLYIDDLFGGNIYKYTPTGKYIKALLKSGQGPGEIALKIGRSIFNMDENYVLVSDYGKQDYCKYTLDGAFIGMEPKYAILASKNIFAFWKGTELYCYIRHYYEQHSKINRDSLFFFTVRDLATDSVIFKLQNYHFDIKGEVIGPHAVIPCAPAFGGVIDDSLLWVKPVNQDTVFCTTDWKDLRPLYIIKQSKDAADYAWLTILWSGADNYSYDEIINRTRLWGIWALKGGLLYFYAHGPKAGTGFCSANGKAKTFSKLFKNDVDEYCPSIDFGEFLYRGALFEKNGYLYLLIDAFNFFEKGAKSPFPDLTEDSNPVVVKLKLK